MNVPEAATPNPEQPTAGEDREPETRILLVRHGETEWNAANRVQGQLNPGLSETGRGQAERLVRRLAREPITAIYSSTLARAQETAAPVAHASNLPVRGAPGFQEAGFGEWEGLTTAEIRARYPLQYEDWRRDAIRHRPPGGETIESLLARSMAEMQRVLAAHVGETVLVVAHGGTIRCLVVGLLELTLAVYSRLRVENASITSISVRGAITVLVSFNDTTAFEETRSCANTPA